VVADHEVQAKAGSKTPKHSNSLLLVDVQAILAGDWLNIRNEAVKASLGAAYFPFIQAVRSTKALLLWLETAWRSLSLLARDQFNPQGDW
jgi:hypothetical protein